METIRESRAVATPTIEDDTPDVTGPTQDPARDATRSGPEIALQIRMTTSSLIGIALMQRNPVPESTRA